jgi:hypothetical protein
LGLDSDSACALGHIPARRLADLCGAVLVWASVVLALALEVGSLVVARRTRHSGIRLRRITFLRRRRARSCMDHRLHRIMGGEEARKGACACAGEAGQGGRRVFEHHMQFS